MEKLGGREEGRVLTDALRSALQQITDGTVPNTLESQTLEFKTVGRSRNDALKTLAESAACFANARGGNIVVGVSDARGGDEAFVGCTLDPTRTARRIFELTDPPLTAAVDEEQFQRHRLLVITVPASAAVHAVGGRSPERVGDSCEQMSTLRIATVVADRRGEDWSDRDAGVPAVAASPMAIAAARSLLERSTDQAATGYASQSDLDLLRGLGCIAPSGQLNNAGALLFTDRLDHDEVIAYIHRRTPSGAFVVNERLTGATLPALERVFDLIEARLDRTSVNLPGGQQLQIADLPDPAVREAVINAVMHRDYRRHGPVQIEHSATRLTVDSPGPFVTGVNASNVLTTSSRPRNIVLARAIRILGLAETAGSGVDRMYVEMARVGHQPPTFHDDRDRVRVRLLGGAPNAAIARFTASLPTEEARDADTMLVLLHLLTSPSVAASEMAPLLQKDLDETLATLDRLSSTPVHLIERTRGSARRADPRFRLREEVVAALGSAITYRRRTPDEADRKIIRLVRETGEINSRMVRLMLDLDVTATSRVLSDLVERGILLKTSKAQRGPGVTYGPGPRFPRRAKRSRKRAASSSDQPGMLDEDPSSGL
jgi:ATP-dependent DNA helicase RecG